MDVLFYIIWLTQGILSVVIALRNDHVWITIQELNLTTSVLVRGMGLVAIGGAGLILQLSVKGPTQIRIWGKKNEVD